jgi:hypothetical protein
VAAPTHSKKQALCYATCVLGRPSRRVWIAAIVVSIVCVAGLAYGLVSDWDTVPDRTHTPTNPAQPASSGFSLGVVVGIGAGIILGSLIALRRR